MAVIILFKNKSKANIFPHLFQVLLLVEIWVLRRVVGLKGSLVGVDIKTRATVLLRYLLHTNRSNCSEVVALAISESCFRILHNMSM